MIEAHREAFARSRSAGADFDIELSYLKSISDLGASLTAAPLPATIVQHLSKAITDMFLPSAYLIVTADLATERRSVALSYGVDGGASSDDPRVRSTLAEGSFLATDAGCWMGSSIIAAGRPYGAVCVIPPEGVQYDETDLAALNGVASVAGLALQGANLYEQLSIGKREWESTVDSIPQAFCIVDERGRVRRGNLAFCDLVNVPVTTVADRPWPELLPPEWVEQVSRVLALAVSERIDTDDRSHLVSALKVRNHDVDHTVLIFEDITDREKLQDQLAQSAKMTAVGQLVSGVAHDLTSPLASIVGFSDYLTSGNVEIPPYLTEPLTAIRQEAERAAGIVKQLLSFARKQDRTRSARQIGEVIESTLVLMKNQLVSHKVEARFTIAADLPPVLINFGQIQQVFVNLINNAAQAIALSGEGDHITVSAHRTDNDAVEVVFSDNGPGIDPENRLRVYEPFFTTKDDSEGTGLGLSISAGIISEHGGKLTLDAASGPGATFRLVLPVAADAGVGAQTSVSPIPPRRILVVDGDLHMQRYLEATLESWGHTVRVAADEDEAMAILEHFPADLAISDLRMPNISGSPLYDRLQESDQELARRTVFTTGDAMRRDTRDFLDSLGRPHLQKPFTLVQLQSALAEIDAPN